MSIHDLTKIVGRAAKALYDNEKFPVGVLAVRAKKIAEAHPTDPTAVAMFNFLNKRASSQPFITRAELRDAYRRLYSQNNKFGSVFAEELGPSGLAQPHVMQHDPNEGKNLVEESYAKMADPVLANSLSSAFDKKASYTPYSAEVAVNAARTCLHELNRFVAPRKVDVVAGKPDLLICKATYGTPKGDTVALVPVEAKEGKALIPTVFLSRVGFLDLSKEALQQHIVDTAGKHFKVDVQNILDVVSNVKNGAPEPLSEMEMIIAKARAAKGTPATHTMDGILYAQLETPVPNIEIEKTAETEEFGKRLASSKGAAEFIFGKKVVYTGRAMLKQSLASFGYSNPNISVVDADNNGIYFAVSVDNKAAFKVPVKVAKGNVQSPEFAVSAGSIYEFSKSGVSSILASDEVDGKMMALASPQHDLRPEDLIEQVRIAMLDGNHPMAEDALTVLQNSNNSAAYKAAFNIYLQGMSGKLVKDAECQSKCAMQRKVAYSKHVICGHTNLPVHKVYQDKNGDCQPLYRRHIAEPETASFLHSKVYLG